MPAAAPKTCRTSRLRPRRLGRSQKRLRRSQSRSRSDAAPLPIPLTGTGPPPEGYSINVGSGYINELYLVNVTAEGQDLGVAELEAKVSRLTNSSGSY